MSQWAVLNVDLMDRLMSSYRPMVRWKKWWWPLFLNALNVSIVASWRIYSAVNDASQAIDHLSFRRNISMCLLKSGSDTERRQVGGGHRAYLPQTENIGRLSWQKNVAYLKPEPDCMTDRCAGHSSGPIIEGFPADYIWITLVTVRYWIWGGHWHQRADERHGNPPPR